MVETSIVGITRSGITSKRRRTNNQAVGLHKEKSQIYAHEQRNTTCCTYNTRSSARAQTAGASPAHYAARSNSKTRSRSPVQKPNQFADKKRDECGERRTRKNRDPTRDWNPAMVSFVFQYSPPTNTPSSADITICARKNVLSLKAPQTDPTSNTKKSKKISYAQPTDETRTVAAPSTLCPPAPPAASRTPPRSSGSQASSARLPRAAHSGYR